MSRYGHSAESVSKASHLKHDGDLYSVPRLSSSSATTAPESCISPSSPSIAVPDATAYLTVNGIPDLLSKLPSDPERPGTISRFLSDSALTSDQRLKSRDDDQVLMEAGYDRKIMPPPRRIYPVKVKTDMEEEDHEESHRIPRIQEQPASPSEENTNNNDRGLYRPESYLSASCTSLHSARYSCVVPLTEVKQEAASDEVKRGQLLCAVQISWYSRRASGSETCRNHLQLRQTRLRWREFDAILKQDRLDLYLTTSLMVKTKRRAHVIYLNTSRKRNLSPVQLSLVSSVDYNWALQFRSKEGRTIRFLFVARNRSESQDWYMALYRICPLKRPIPPSIDLFLPTLDDLQIQLPLGNLDRLVKYNVHLEHVKRSALMMLEQQDIKPSHWTENNVALCWRDAHQRLEWVIIGGEDRETQSYLIHPRLIEQTHTLELRPFCKTRLNPGLLPKVMEGPLLSWTDGGGRPYKKRSSQAKPIYAIIDGHLLFLLEPSKATKPKSQTTRNQSRKTFGRLFQNQPRRPGVSLGSSFLQSASRFFSFANHKTFTATAPSDEEEAALLAEQERQASNLREAFAVLDMERATIVRRARESTPSTSSSNSRQRCLEIKVGDVVLQFEATTVQETYDWMMQLRKALQSKNTLIRETQLLGSAEERKSILHSGLLYVRCGYLDTYKLRYCVLTRGHGLIFYKTHRRKRCSGQAQPWATYERLTVLPLQKAYVYSDTAAHHAADENQRPPRIFADGTMVDEDHCSDCTIVIWRTAQRRVFVSLRERFSTMKLGHRLGRKGTVWILLTRNREEKEVWAWALHQEIDLYES